MYLEPSGLEHSDSIPGKSSGMWCLVTGRAVTDVSKDRCGFFIRIKTFSLQQDRCQANLTRIYWQNLRCWRFTVYGLWASPDSNLLRTEVKVDEAWSWPSRPWIPAAYCTSPTSKCSLSCEIATATPTPGTPSVVFLLPRDRPHSTGHSPWLPRCTFLCGTQY
jgi:hypothetical protein